MKKQLYSILLSLCAVTLISAQNIHEVSGVDSSNSSSLNEITDSASITKEDSVTTDSSVAVAESDEPAILLQTKKDTVLLIMDSDVKKIIEQAKTGIKLEFPFLNILCKLRPENKSQRLYSILIVRISLLCRSNAKIEPCRSAQKSKLYVKYKSGSR